MDRQGDEALEAFPEPLAHLLGATPQDVLAGSRPGALLPTDDRAVPLLLPVDSALTDVSRARRGICRHLLVRRSRFGRGLLLFLSLGNLLLLRSRHRLRVRYSTLRLNLLELLRIHAEVLVLLVQDLLDFVVRLIHRLRLGSLGEQGVHGRLLDLSRLGFLLRE